MYGGRRVGVLVDKTYAFPCRLFTALRNLGRTLGYNLRLVVGVCNTPPSLGCIHTECVVGSYYYLITYLAPLCLNYLIPPTPSIAIQFLVPAPFTLDFRSLFSFHTIIGYLRI
jgi:hypothetical protein